VTSVAVEVNQATVSTVSALSHPNTWADLGTLVQVADLVPWAETCAGAGLVIGSGAAVGGAIAGAAIGYQTCKWIDRALNVGSAISTQWQILTSGCSNSRKTVATVANVANFALDIKAPLTSFLGEAGSYLTSTAALQCEQTGSSSNYRADKERAH
jgi:hypothetical protein